MSLIDPIAIAVIATAGSEHLRLRDYIQCERRFREALREYPRDAPAGMPYVWLFHQEFYLNDPYLQVTLCEAEGWCNGLFVHDPLRPARYNGENYNEWQHWEDRLSLRQDDRVGARTVRPSPALLKAIKRVLDEP